MKQSAVGVLHLEPRSKAELHEAIHRFEEKWQRKADRYRV